MPTKPVINENDKTMNKAVEFLKSEFKAIRTGRASTGLVEHLKVEYYGNPTPIKQLATLSAPDATSIVIKPFDPAAVKDIEKAIKISEIGLTPMTDGGTIRLNVPPLSEERRKQISNQIKQLGEKSKVSLRNIRRDTIKKLEDMEKAKEITEDIRDKAKKEIEDHTKKYTNIIDEEIKIKVKEVMES